MKGKEELEKLGVDVDEGLDRVMGDESLYEMMLGMFLDALNESPIELGEFDGADLEPLIRKVHALKGTTGNLSLTPLFNGYVEVLGFLRGNQPEEAKAAMEKIIPVQEKIVECIKQNQD